MLQLLHVGLGPLGRRVVADVCRRGIARIVGAVDPSSDLVGRELSELVEEAPSGVRVVASLEEVEDWDAVGCAIVTTQSDLELCMDTFRALLGRGKAIVSTCEELSWPWLRHPVHAAELHELAVRFGGRLLGTGINPGFLMDALPVAAMTACQRIERVTIERVQEASTRRIPFQKKIGATLSPEAFQANVAEGTLRHVGLGESLHFVAHSLGMRIEKWDETLEPVFAEEDLECGLGAIPKGHARGVRQVATGWVDGEAKLELVFLAAIGEPDPRDRVRVEGEPSFEVVIPGGVHGDVSTSAVVINSIRSLLGAEPGLHTMSSLPLRGCATPDDYASR